MIIMGVKVYTTEELAVILKDHKDWWCGNGGRRADLGGAYLGGACLRGAYLRGAYLDGAYLGGADLGGADLGRAYLGGADLGSADLGGADLGRADLRGAHLRGAYLNGANLRGAYLRGADLRGADLGDVKMNWQSHTLIAERLLRAAGDDVEKRKFAGLVLISLDWCWREFLALKGETLEWVLDTMAEWVRDGDDAPVVLTSRVSALALKESVNGNGAR